MLKLRNNVRGAWLPIYCSNLLGNNLTSWYDLTNRYFSRFVDFRFVREKVCYREYFFKLIKNLTLNAPKYSFLNFSEGSKIFSNDKDSASSTTFQCRTIIHLIWKVLWNGKYLFESSDRWVWLALFALSDERKIRIQSSQLSLNPNLKEITWPVSFLFYLI